MTNDEMSTSRKRKLDDSVTETSGPTEREGRKTLKTQESFSDDETSSPMSPVLDLFTRRPIITAESNASEALSTASMQDSREGNAQETDDGKPSADTMTASKPAEKTVRNAFNELMAPKAKKAMVQPQPNTPSGLRLANPNSRGRGDTRDELGFYASNPKTVPKDLAIYDSDDFVAIKDLYPKASVHVLLLFKSPRNTLHPFHFFEDPDMLAKARKEIQRVRRMVAEEMRKKFGQYSLQDKKREQVLRGEIGLAAGEGLPKGRDWESEVMVGVHARPSMNHVHVHILSPDRFSTFIKTRNHYQSFNTPFFVNMDELPLAPDDPRWDSNVTNGYIREDFRCWRCGKTGFKNLPDLKQHLSEEFKAWRAE